MSGEGQFTYDLEVTLTAPPGGVLAAIFVKVEIDPVDSGCLIYGKDAGGKYQCIKVMGSHERLELPFAHPEIHVKYLKGLQNFRISTLGHRDSER